MRFTDVLNRLERSELSLTEAAELLGFSERTFRRWRDRHREAGGAGLADRRLAASLRRAPMAEIERMLGLYREDYRGLPGRPCVEDAPRRHPSRRYRHMGTAGVYRLAALADGEMGRGICRSDRISDREGAHGIVD
jgi:hypothetical protein